LGFCAALATVSLAPLFFFWASFDYCSASASFLIEILNQSPIE
jgi:hypothetical protein